MGASVQTRRRIAVRPRRGGVEVSDVQRSRVLGAAAWLVAREGYEGLSVARIIARARVSRRTFYDVFEDREDCFLAVFEDALARARGPVVEAYGAAGGGWVERVRAGLVALLAFFEREPRVASLLVVDALRAGPRVLHGRAEVLGELGCALESGGGGARRGEGLSGWGSAARLLGEGVVGGAFSVIHTRLSSDGECSSSLLDLVSPLMGMIVLPYRGVAAARRESERPAPLRVSRRGAGVAHRVPARGGVFSGDPLAGLGMRLTYRTLRVLGAIAENPGASNRAVGEAAGIGDQGQISKLLARLRRLGLIENTGLGGHLHGEPNAWRLTGRGGQVERAMRVARPGEERVWTVDEGRDGG